jgi:FlaA1/EpsC-like NDP-sugar epimerase
MSLAKGEGNRGIFMSSPDGRVKIVDLAKSMAKDYGLDPERDIDIEYILSENPVEWKDEIRLDGNRVEKTPYENIIQVIPPRCFESREISEDIESFQRLIGERNREGIIRLVQERMKRIDERVRAIDAMVSAEEVTQSSLPATHQ